MKNRLFALLAFAGIHTSSAQTVKDNYAAAPLTTDNQFTETFDPTGFTTQPGEPSHRSYNSTVPTTLSGWWQWRAPENGLMLLDLSATGTSYPLWLAVYSAPGTWTPHGKAESESDSSQPGPNYRISRLRIPVVKDRLYYIASASGNITPPSPAATTTMAWTFIPFAASSFIGIVSAPEDLFAGCVRLNTSKRGDWSGHLELGGRRYPMRGIIGADGKGFAVVRLRLPKTVPAEPPIPFEFDFLGVEGTGQIAVKLRYSNHMVSTLLHRTRRYSSSDPCPWQGRYTLLSEDHFPRHDWPCVLDVRANGSFRSFTYLPDKTTVVGSGQICPESDPDFAILTAYNSRYGGRGMWLMQTRLDASAPPISASGNMLLQIPPNRKRAFFPEGFVSLSFNSGARYFAPAANEWVHSNFGTAAGASLFSFFLQGAGSFPPVVPAFSQAATLHLDGRFTFAEPNPQKVRARFQRTTGLITGDYISAAHPGRRVPFRLIFSPSVPSLSVPGFAGFFSEPHVPGRASLVPD